MIKNADGIKDFFWKPESGPIENLLGLVEYGYMFLGGFWGKAAIMLATLMGLSIRDFGRKLDSMLGLRDLKDLANMRETDMNISELMFKGSSSRHRDVITKLSLDKRALPSLVGLLKVLKNVAGKIMTGGLLSFLTLKGLQAAKANGVNQHELVSEDQPEEDTNNTDEKRVNDVKTNLENSIMEALAS